MNSILKRLSDIEERFKPLPCLDAVLTFSNGEKRRLSLAEVINAVQVSDSLVTGIEWVEDNSEFLVLKSALENALNPAPTRNIYDFSEE